jgi:hypothetical protein
MKRVGVGYKLQAASCKLQVRRRLRTEDRR